MRAALLLLLAAAPAGAQMYTWTDEKGVEHFSSTPPKDPKTAKKAKERRPDTRPVVFKRSGAAEAAVAAAPAKKAQAPAAQAPVVELFVTSWCRYCREARAYLDGKGVPYTAYDIEQDAAAARRFATYGGPGVPLVLVDGKAIRGFSAPALDALLAK